MLKQEILNHWVVGLLELFLEKCIPIRIIITRKIIPKMLKRMNLFLRMRFIIVFISFPLFDKSSRIPPSFFRFEISRPVWSYSCPPTSSLISSV